MIHNAIDEFVFLCTTRIWIEKCMVPFKETYVDFDFFVKK